MKYLFLLCLLFASISYASVDFTVEDLELVKGACLAGSGFEFSTKADGSISIKNLEGKGELHVTKKSVDTVDLPDDQKKQEFNDIRACIQKYLLNDKIIQNNLEKVHGDSLQENVLGTWQTHTNGNFILPSTDETYVFLPDSTVRVEVIADFGWPQGKKTTNTIATFKVLSSHTLKIIPNGMPDQIVEYEKPSYDVLNLKKDGKNQTLIRITR